MSNKVTTDIVSYTGLMPTDAIHLRLWLWLNTVAGIWYLAE